MSSDERQEAIWDIILQRKFETVPNLADELGVCTRTIYGDVTKMRKKYRDTHIEIKLRNGQIL